ncbi:MAG: hypothetical protein H8F28_26130 [Fibrella sp.]|nr:hypothetical protein [Armatimonadota bacterium]
MPRLSIAFCTGLLAANIALAQTDLADTATANIANAVKKSGVRNTQYDFYARPPYRTDVPKPDAVLGYPIGSWHTTYRDQERTLLSITGAASDRTRVWEYGKSVEGRPLRLIAVSSPRNIARLEEIRTANLRLADVRNLSPVDAESLTKTTPAIVWINHCIHGSETASFETVMATLYTLAASESPEITGVLDNAVIILNPVFNPDGHERFVVSFNAFATGSAESWAFENETPWAMQGRFNHNRFDMNRDKIAQSQPETRQETREFLRWLPHIFVDQHGQPETYFFPPNAQATNPHVDRARMEKWTAMIGKANGAAFDKNGWSYVNRETYDLFYPGYLDSFASLCGAIGMTYETDGGGNLVTKKGDGTLTTLRDAVAHHFEAAIATARSAASNREALVRDFAAFRRSAVGQTGQVVISSNRDPKRAEELVALLLRLGIEVKTLTAPFKTASARPYESNGTKPVPQSFPTGSLVIDYAQPQGHLARALLERDTAMESEFVKAQVAKRKINENRNENESTEEYEFYDTTAWSLPLIHGLEAFALDNGKINSNNTRFLSMGADGATIANPVPGGITGELASATAFAIPFATDNAAMLATRYLQEGYRLSVATKPVTVNAKKYNAGTLFVRPSRNPDDAVSKLDSLSRLLGVSVEAIPTTFGGGGANDAGLGSQNIVPVTAPRIAIVAGDGVSQTGYGGTAFMLKQAGVLFTAIPTRALKNPEARAAFNVIVLPEGSYKSRFTKEDIAALKDWVSNGGCLIGLGSGATWLTTKEADMTSVRVVGESSESKDEKEKINKSEQPLSLPGAIFKASIRTDHFLGWGYPDGTLPVPLSGTTFWKKSDTGANVITFAEKGQTLLSGFAWNGNTEKLLAGTAYVVDEPIGSGHAILFLNDPTERYLYVGLRRLFLSAILFGSRR